MAARRSSGPESAADVAARAMAESGMDLQLEAARIFEHWADWVGPELAAHARPLTLRYGVLTIGAEDPAWLQEVRYVSRQLIARIHAECPRVKIKRLAFRCTSTPADDGPEG